MHNGNIMILVVQPPKFLLSGSLEHETSMDIERIVVGEIAAIWLLLG